MSGTLWDGLRATLRLPVAYEMLEWIDARGSDVGVLPQIELTVELRMWFVAALGADANEVQKRIFRAEAWHLRGVVSRIEQRMRPCAFGRTVQQVVPEQIDRADATSGRIFA
jgi:hypothetical protein